MCVMHAIRANGEWQEVALQTNLIIHCRTKCLSGEKTTHPDCIFQELE